MPHFGAGRQICVDILITIPVSKHHASIHETYIYLYRCANYRSFTVQNTYVPLCINGSIPYRHHLDAYKILQFLKIKR